MITIKSNIDEILKRYEQKKDKLNKTLIEISIILSNRIKEDMVKEINRNIDLWSKSYDSHRFVNPESEIEIIPTDKGARISIGNNSQKLTMSDGSLVNPYYFIEFGFGIRGQQNPKENASNMGWNYNINEHTKAWFFIGNDGEKHATTGRIGINFIYNTIQKYKDNWQNIVKEEYNKRIF